MSNRGAIDVVIFVPGLASGGGAEKTALATAAALVEAGLAVTCFTDPGISRDDLSRHFSLDLDGVSFAPLPSPRLPGRTPRALRELVRDLAHVRSMRAASPRLFINMKFKSELPGIGSHNWYYTYFPHHLRIPRRSAAHAIYLSLVSMLRRTALLWGGGRFLDSYQLVLACSEFSRRHVRLRWNVDATTLYPPCSQTVGAPPRDRTYTILSVGRFQADGPNIPHKRQDVLIEAFAGLPDLPGADWNLHLVGAVGTSQADRNYLDRIRDMAVGLPVHVHANASHELLSNLTSHARIYWHAQGFGTDSDSYPEAQEHFGISTVEAMAAGIVPVVYATAGPAEVVQGEPELMWRTREELVAKTLDLMDEGRWQHWQEKCTQRAAEFSVDAFTEHLLALYQGHVGPIHAHASGDR